MSISVDYDGNDVASINAISKVEDAILTDARNRANEIYKVLEKEYEYQTTDEAIAEMLKSNDYEFNEETLKIDASIKTKKISKNASAFDKVEKVDVAEGLFAVKNKETNDIEVKDLAGKVVETFPDAFGDDIVPIIKLLNQVVKPLKEKEEKGKKDKEVGEKKDKELEELKSALEASKQETLTIKASLESLELKTALDSRMADCKVLAQVAYEKGVLDVDQKFIESEVRAGKDIMKVKAEAIKRTIDRQVRDLMRMDDSQIKAFASTMERFTKTASKRSSGKLKDGFIASADLSVLSDDKEVIVSETLKRMWSKQR